MASEGEATAGKGVFAAQAAFNAAAEFMSGPGARKLRLSNEHRLRLYSHYKQCTVGDCHQARPGMLDMVGKAKWDAWKKLEGMSSTYASVGYIAAVDELCPNWRDIKEDPLQGAVEVDDDEDGGDSVGFTPAVSTLSANYREEDGWTDGEEIFKAASNGDLHTLQAWLQAMGDANIQEEQEGRTPLHYACDRGQTEAARLLLEGGASLNAADSEGQTPLHYAVACEHHDLVKLLVGKGADITAVDSYGETPLGMANSSIMALLRPAG